MKRARALRLLQNMVEAINDYRGNKIIFSDLVSKLLGSFEAIEKDELKNTDIRK